VKNLKHLSNIHEAAQELHKRLIGSSWYIRAQVLSLPPEAGPVQSREERREIVVYTKEAGITGPETFNSWPVRYEAV
jgi:hypothetical protein